MKAEQFLEKIRKYDTLINNKLIECEQWKEMALNTSANVGDGDNVQSSKNLHKMEDAVCRIVDIQNEIDAAVKGLIECKQRVISYIERLEPDDYDILHKLYVQYMDLQDVADAYGKSYSLVIARKRNALDALQEMLDREVKDENKN